MRLLLVEDQPDLQKYTAKALFAGGFAVDAVGTLADASDAAAVARYDIFLLDRKLPDGDSVDWLRERRRAGNVTPAIVLTGTGISVTDRIDGLYAGADDYLQKPVALDEVVARVRGLLRRVNRATAIPLVSVGNLDFDPNTREVFVDERRIPLNRRETGLLEQLVRNAGRVVVRQSIEESQYSLTEVVTANAIEVTVCRLRTALNQAGAKVRVNTVRGVGYMISAETQS